MPMNTQPISMTTANNHKQSTVTAHPPDYRKTQQTLLSHTKDHNKALTNIPLTGAFLLFPLQDLEECHCNT